MPRHPPIALKTLDRSHCQCPPARSRRDFASAKSCAGFSWMSLAQKDQLLEIGSRVRLGKPIICGRLSVSRDKSHPYGHEVRTNLLFTMSYRTGGEPRSSPQTFKRMTCQPVFISTRHPFLFSEERWWSRTGSNRRHPACKAGALPAELRPLIPFVEEMVGLGGLEPPTSRLSSARSNQLSYKP
jgi:hypothetical protein